MSGILKFLGVDGGFGKNNTSAYVILGRKLLLIDCGFTVYGELQKKNLIRPDWDYDVILTHMHPDHFGSLGQLAFTVFYSFKKPINVITQAKKFEAGMDAVGTGKDIPRPNDSFPKMAYTRNNTYDVQFIVTPHAANMDCYGFMLELDGKRIVYTGDTSTIATFLPYITPETEFYTEAFATGGGGVHLDIIENLEVLSDIANRCAGVYLMHMDDKEKIAEIIKGTKIQMAEEE